MTRFQICFGRFTVRARGVVLALKPIFDPRDGRGSGEGLDWLSESLYISTITRMYVTRLRRGSTGRKDAASISLLDAQLQRKIVARHLTAVLRNCAYWPDNPGERVFVRNGKARRIFHYGILDSIVQGVLYKCLVEQAEKQLPENVFGYLPGRSAAVAVERYRLYLKCLPKTNCVHRDLYVLRTDVSSYSESIPCAPTSRLRIYLDKLVEKLPHPEKHGYLRQLIWELLRPTLVTDEGAPYQRLCGLPTGSPLNNLSCFIYLQSVDAALGSIPGAFYIRYGDDIIFAHPVLSKFSHGLQILERSLSELSLHRNSEKDLLVFLNKAGRSPEGEEKINATAIDKPMVGGHNLRYLGQVISVSGDVALPPPRVNAFVKRILSRAENIARMVWYLDAERRGGAIAHGVSIALSIGHPLADETLHRVLRLNSNRDLLRQIDYRIALRIAELVSGVRGVRAWRSVSYKKIRSEWGLVSLCNLKNELHTTRQKDVIRGP